MTRDPSDGSVREKPKFDGTAENSSTGANNASPDSELLSSTTSGLPATKRADQLARLERDREWLKNYLHRKSEGTDAK